jgi:hypothetical protein
LDFALTRCIASVPPGPERDALKTAAAEPSLTNIRAVLAIGMHRPWRELIESALVEIGLAAIDDILRKDQS